MFIFSQLQTNRVVNDAIFAVAIVTNSTNFFEIFKNRKKQYSLIYFNNNYGLFSLDPCGSVITPEIKFNLKEEREICFMFDICIVVIQFILK